MPKRQLLNRGSIRSHELTHAMNQFSTASPEISEEPVVFIIGENIQAHKAYYGEKTGSLTKIARGVFVRTDITPLLRKNAILEAGPRIAAHLYPSAVLCGPSGYRLAVVNGVLSIATNRTIGRIDIGGVFEINAHSSNDVTGARGQRENVFIQDALGRHQAKRFTPEYMLLASFRKATARARAIPNLSPGDLVELVNALLRSTGEADVSIACAQIERRVENLSELSDLKVSFDDLREYLKGFAVKSLERRKVQELSVLWHDRPVGTLTNDGAIWEFGYAPAIGLKLSLSEDPSVKTLEVPNFMGSILPENSRSNADALEDRMDLFIGATRFISNITVRPVNDEQRHKYVPDILGANLGEFSTDLHEFKGRVAPKMHEIISDPQLLNSARSNPGMPRISGMQVKLPCNLDASGNLDLAIDRSFSHMVKVVGGGTEYSSMCSMEWFSLTVAKQIGLSVEDFVIADIGMSSPALIVERFDIRKDFNDKRLILAEDFWSILGLRKNELKYNGDLIDVAEVIMKHSTNKNADALQLLAQSMISWVMFNGDMHLKNLLMIKETRDIRNGFESIRLSPAYDMMCTQVFPNDPKSAAIAIAGNRNHTLHGFITLGKALGIDPEHVVTMAMFISTNVANTGHTVSKLLPRVIAQHSKSVADIKLATRLFDSRCMGLIKEVEMFTSKKSTAISSKRVKVDETEVYAHVVAEKRRSQSPMDLTGEDECESFDGSGVAEATETTRRTKP